METHAHTFIATLSIANRFKIVSSITFSFLFLFCFFFFKSFSILSAVLSLKISHPNTIAFTSNGSSHVLVHPNAYMYVYIYIYTCIYMYTHIHLHTYTFCTRNEITISTINVTKSLVITKKNFLFFSKGSTSIYIYIYIHILKILPEDKQKGSY